MKSVASAPGKVILFGEHFVVYGVKAILASIDRRVTVTSTLTNEKDINIRSNLGQFNVETEKPLSEIKSPFKPIVFITKKIFEKHDYKDGADIMIESEIPSGVGLGSSSACCVAATASVSNLFSHLNREMILEIAVEAEKTIFKDVSGADSTVSTFGGIMEYTKQNGYSRINSKPEFELVIANSKQTHSTNKLVNKVKKFREGNLEKFQKLCEMESKLIERAVQDLKANNSESLGKAMSENQNYLEEMGVSNKRLNSMIEIADKTSYGSKLTGAGGGGCIIALTDDSNSLRTFDNLKLNNFECFKVKIDFEGLHNF